MKVKEYFHNIKCDCCGELASEEWWNSEESAREAAFEADYMEMADDKMYCSACRTVNDEGDYVIKNGYVYDGNTQELMIKPLCWNDMTEKEKSDFLYKLSHQNNQ